VRFVFVISLIAVCSSGLSAQSSDPADEPRIHRWFELQAFTVYSRYRFIENSAEITTSDQLQYKEAIKARFNIDDHKRYTINVGYFSGNSFISSWNNWGPGTGSFDGRDHYFKQLFASAEPVRGIEVQYGGLYVIRGENDDLTTYDDDGYIVGERLSVRRPKTLFFDEISVTRGSTGSFNQPNLARRWSGLSHPDYGEVLLDKGLKHGLAGSVGYTRQSGSDTIRAAVTIRLAGKSPVNLIRYEQYRRVDNNPASGFAASADRLLPRGARLQAGYVTVDQFYGGWNADRIQSGRRVFAVLTIPIVGPLSMQLFGTQALPSAYPVALGRRYEAVIAYDILSSLKHRGAF
jgi:hypothetical protein